MDEMQEEIKVLIKINDNQEIICINSSTFVHDTESYIEIDSGTGDKYAHAQNNYFDMALTDEYGRYNYKYIDSQVVEVQHEEYVPKDDDTYTTEEILNALLEVD